MLAQRQTAEKSNEITAFIPLLAPLDLTGHVITADAMQTQRANARSPAEDKDAHFIFPALDNQPTPFDPLNTPDWKNTPITARTEDLDQDRREIRTTQIANAPADMNSPHAHQTLLIEHTAARKDATSYQTMIYTTSLTAQQAGPADLLAHIRGHWTIEATHRIRDIAHAEDAPRVHTGNTPRITATPRNTSISPLRLHDATTIATAPRHNARKDHRVLRGRFVSF